MVSLSVGEDRHSLIVQAERKVWEGQGASEMRSEYDSSRSFDAIPKR